MKKYAVIGNPIAHSQSPQIHQAFAKQFGLDIEYLKILTEKETFENTVQEFQQQRGLGMNVTMPFKKMALELCDTLSDYAKQAGAVNTLCFQSNGKIHGDNTDGLGLIQDLTKNHHCPLKDKHLLIFGAGGAVRGALPALINEKPESITLINRTFAKAQELAEKYDLDACELDDVLTEKYDVLINGSGYLNLGQHDFKEDAFAYDMNYAQTAPWPQSLKQANGYGMLVEQAAQSFYLWHGLRPNTSKLFRDHHGHVRALGCAEMQANNDL